MKKGILVALVVALMINAGCDSSKTQKADEVGEQAAQQQAVETAEEESEEAGEQATDDSATADEDAEAAGPVEDIAAGETGQYGGEFTIEDEPITLAAALEQAAETDGPVKVEADVQKACKKKGCWFTLTGEGIDQPVRVRMKDYGFFVPRNSAGAKAVVEGIIEKRVVPEEEAQHYADDEVAGTDEEPEKIEGDQEGWEMTITAAQITAES